MKKIITIILALIVLTNCMRAQQKALVNTSESIYARLIPVDADAVRWTDGFWGHWFQVCKDTMAMNMLNIYKNDSLCHGYCNFEIAAGFKQGNHRGAPFHDGDFYKTLEAVISVYALTKDKRLYDEFEQIIKIIAKAQRSDGYINTQTTIRHRNNPGSVKEYEDRMNFENYNIGHLMTAACLHYRVTGQTNFLDIAIKASDFLVAYYENVTAEKARSAICPSHYMGIVEMYRTTGNKKYLDLAEIMIDSRGLINNGTDHNQDRIPFRLQREAVGHAVRANYLYAGVADLYMETGEDSLMMALKSIWQDVVTKKMYITGGCGALYDGVSPNGTSYDPDYIQQVHQAYGQAYQLPNITAHNETCANVGNVLWNYRMLLATGDSRYADILELTLYNSVLSGTDLTGTRFNYTNPLRVDHTLPYKLRWEGEREPYIALSNCCPPNLDRTIAEINNYAYALTKTGITVNLYGSNTLTTNLLDGSKLILREETDYPWNDTIKIIFDEVPNNPFDISLRIPGWADQENSISFNNQNLDVDIKAGKYAVINRKWKKGDVIELILPMGIKLMAANRLVEETHGQVAVKRGPIVYCLESVDMKGKDIFDVILPVDIKLKPMEAEIAGVKMICLEGEAFLKKETEHSSDLYYALDTQSKLKNISVRLIPYFAWGNRGASDMSVWIPVRQ